MVGPRVGEGFGGSSRDRAETVNGYILCGQARRYSNVFKNALILEIDDLYRFRIRCDPTSQFVGLEGLKERARDNECDPVLGKRLRDERSRTKYQSYLYKRQNISSSNTLICSHFSPKYHRHLDRVDCQSRHRTRHSLWHWQILPPNRRLSSPGTQT